MSDRYAVQAMPTVDTNGYNPHKQKVSISTDGIDYTDNLELQRDNPEVE